MLARTQWTRPSLDDFIAWLETKPPGEEYQWWKSSACACTQYATSIGVDRADLWGNALVLPFWTQMNFLAREQPWTFGGLLERVLRHKADG